MTGSDERLARLHERLARAAARWCLSKIPQAIRRRIPNSMTRLIRPNPRYRRELNIVARSLDEQEHAIRQQAHQISRLETMTKELVSAIESLRERQTNAKN